MPASPSRLFKAVSSSTGQLVFDFFVDLLRFSQWLSSFCFPLLRFLKPFRENRFDDLGQQPKKGCRLYSLFWVTACAQTNSPRMNLLLYVLYGHLR